MKQFHPVLAPCHLTTRDIIPLAPENGPSQSLCLALFLLKQRRKMLFEPDLL